MGLRRSWITAFRVSAAAGSSSLVAETRRTEPLSAHRRQQGDDPPRFGSRPSSSSSWWFGKSRVVSCEASMNNPAAHISWSASSQQVLSGRPGSTTVYDFVIIGHGCAGQAALATVRALCPNARVGVVDPFSEDLNGNGVELWRTRSIGLCTQKRQVLVESAAGDDDDEDVSLSYKYGVLVATGAHGAPPPHYLLDNEASHRVLELRSTILPTPASIRPIHGMSHAVQHMSFLVKKKNIKMAILGSGWEALELTARCTHLSKNRPVLIMGASGPLSHILPSYLCTALTKRLRSKGVTVLDRSLVRYIAHQSKHANLQLYTAKSYDFLDGSTATADYAMIAPSIQSSQGSAALASHDIPEFLWESAKSRSWYKTWSHLATDGLVSCYQDDGRIMVNQELCAGTQVYAAGSVAKYPNRVSGNAAVAGGGYEAAAEAGRVAATNMVREYLMRNNSGNTLFGSSAIVHDIVTQDPIHVYRSDRVLDESSSLARLGVQSLSVGKCDPNSSTHAVWWTNQAAQRRLMSLEVDNSASEKQHKASKIVKPVYGIGVIFYLDRIGRIQGVMTWGLPFAEQRTGALNPLLVEQLKDVIRTNGGFRELTTELDHVKMSRYMETTSKQLVLTAMATDDRSLEKLPRPLHRYTDVRPNNLRHVGFLKRKDGQGFGASGENLFARQGNDDEGAELLQVPKPNLSSSSLSESAADKLQALYEWTVWEQIESRWDENEQRARPSKEDPLWIRKGDEMRNVPQRERIAAAYSTLLQQSKTN